jgi:recombination protein RecR
MSEPKSFKNLVQEFAKLPGVGPRTATRYAFFLLRKSDAEVAQLAAAIALLKQDTHICKNCFNISENDLCEYCANPKRDRSVICIVEEAINIPVIENTKKFQGLYHVLGGTIKPHEGAGPEKLNIGQLLERIQRSVVKEIIIATNPNLEGETTAMYLVKKLKPFNLHVTHLARGLSTGSDLEYADEMTVSHALEERKEFE